MNALQSSGLQRATPSLGDGATSLVCAYREVHFSGTEERLGVTIDPSAGCVTRVDPGLAAARLGVRAGYTVVRVGGEPVAADAAIDSLQAALRKRQPFSVSFSNENCLEAEYGIARLLRLSRHLCCSARSVRSLRVLILVLLFFATPCTYVLRPAARLRQAAMPCVKGQYGNSVAELVEFLPSAEMPAQFGDDDDIEQFQADLYARLHPAHCPSSDRNLGLGWCPYGTGACFHLLSRPMTAAWENNWTVEVSEFEIQGRSTDAYCLNQSMGCFIADVSNCSYQGGGMYFNAESWPARFVPARWRQKGYFWWVSQQMRYLFRLNPHIHAEVQRVKQKLGFTRPVIGMHVRHGDSCKVRLHCWPFESYMRAAERLRGLYGVSSIYLATDSAEVVQLAASWGDGWRFFYLDIDRSHFDLVLKGEVHSMRGGEPTIDDCHTSGQCDAVTDTYWMMVDLAVLSQTDYFVGAFSANGGRLAYELMAASKGCAPPFISLDVHWCHMGGYAMGGETEWRFTSC